MQIHFFLRAMMVAGALIMVTQTKAADRPNVVFILADDLGWRNLSIQGSTFY